MPDERRWQERGDMEQRDQDGRHSADTVKSPEAHIRFLSAILNAALRWSCSTKEIMCRNVHIRAPYCWFFSTVATGLADLVDVPEF
jgi:hypothetical protein